MAAGVTKRPWEVGDIVDVREPNHGEHAFDAALFVEIEGNILERNERECRLLFSLRCPWPCLVFDQGVNIDAK
jgi:hypothetical protein